MITESNIIAAKKACEKATQEYERNQLNLDAFKTFLSEVVAGQWEAGAKVPLEGPFTVKQAALIDVVIPEDHTMPQAFFSEDVHYRADQVFAQLQSESKLLKEEKDTKCDTLKKMQEQYAQDLDRAEQIASSDPSVIAARENAEAERVKAEREREKEQERKDTRNLVILIAALLFFLIIILMLFARALR